MSELSKLQRRAKLFRYLFWVVFYAGYTVIVVSLTTNTPPAFFAGWGMMLGSFSVKYLSETYDDRLKKIQWCARALE